MKSVIAMLAAATLTAIGCGGGGADATAERQPQATVGAEQASGGGMHRHGMHGRGARTDMAAACPMNVPGAQVAVEPIDEGVAMTFTTDRAQEVTDLRARVRAMASMHEQRAGMGRGMMSTMPAASSAVVDLPDGARLELRANDPTDVDALRQHATMRAQHMQGGQCPMMAQSAPA